MNVDFEDDTPGAAPAVGVAAVTPTTPLAPTNALPVSAGYGVIVAPYTDMPDLPAAGTGQSARFYDYDTSKGIGAEYNFVGDSSQNATAARLSFTFAGPSLTTTGALRVSVGQYDLSASLRFNASANRPFQLSLANDGTLKLAGKSTVTGSFTPGVAHRLDLYVNDDDNNPLAFTGPDGVARTLAANSVQAFVDQVSVGVVAFTTSSTSPNYNLSSSSLGRCGFSTLTSDTNVDFVVDDLEADILTPGSGGTTIPSGLGAGTADPTAAGYDPDVLLWDAFGYSDGELHFTSDARWVVNTGTPTLTVANGAARFDYATPASGNNGQYTRKFSGARSVYRDADATQPGPVVYTAFTLAVERAPAAAGSGYFLALQSTTSATTLNGYVWIRAGATVGTYNLGVSTDGTLGSAIFAAADLVPGVPHRVVVRYDSLTNDSALWLDPADATTPPDATAAKPSDTGAAQFSGVTLRIANTSDLGRFSLDDLRSATSFAGALATAAVAGPVAEILRSGYNFSILGDRFDAYVAANHQIAFLRADGELWLAAEGAAWDVSSNASAVQNGTLIGSYYYKIMTLREVTAGAVSDGRYELTLQNNNTTASTYRVALDTAVATQVRAAGAPQATPIALETAAASDVVFTSAAGHTLRAIGFDTLTPGDGRQYLSVTVPPRGVRQIAFSFDSLSIDAPRDWQVFQRQTRTTGSTTVAGRAPAGTASVTVEFTAGDLLAPPLAGALPTGPQPVALDATTLTFNDTFTLPAGGWYRATIRALDAGGATLATRTISHVGVGEVFLAAGQSNSTNSGQSEGVSRTTSHSGLAVAFSGGHWQPAADPEPGPHDQSSYGSYYPAFCDGLAARLGVPIAIASTGHGGTYVAEWQPDATYNFSTYADAATNGLYQWTLARVKQFAPGGFRALLWHQGESDSTHTIGTTRTSGDAYYANLKRVITSLRADAGWNFPFVVAQASLWPVDTLPVGDPNVTGAQQRLWADGIALAGPNSDALGLEYRQTLAVSESRVHFPPAGIAAHAGLWVEKIGGYLDAFLGQSDSSAPVFIGQPGSRTGKSTANVGEPLVLIATASGVPAPAYQWRKDGVPLTGETAQLLQIAHATAADAATYSVVATNTAGSATSADLVLAVTNTPAAPVVLTPPRNVTTVAGGDATFTVEFSGNPLPTVQWKRNGSVIAGATDATLTLTNVQSAQAGSYTVTLTNASGSVTSSAATLTLASGTAAVLVSPANQTVATGNSIYLSVTAVSPTPATYQWLRNGTAIAGATEAHFALTHAQAADAGSYSVRITNAGGTVTTAAATLTVSTIAGAPVLTISPASQNATKGDDVTFTAAANGTAPLTYQWRKSGLNVPGATTATLTLAAVQPTDAGSYTVTVSNGLGSVTSEPATLTVATPPPSRTTPTLTWAQPTAISAGTALSSAQLNATADVPGIFVYTPSAGTILAPGTHTLSVSFTPDDTVHYTNATAQLELTVEPAGFAPFYFGQFNDGGEWALHVRADRTGIFVATLPSRQSALVLPLTIVEDGHFTATGAELRASATSASFSAGARAVAASEPDTLTLSGQLEGQTATGALDATGLSFSGEADTAPGGSAVPGGVYTAVALGTDQGTVYTIVGPSGRALVVLATPGLTTGGEASVDADGHVVLTTADATQIALSFAGNYQTLTASALLAGATEPIAFAGSVETLATAARIVNLSVRSEAGQADRTLIMGFVVTGTDPQAVLVRGVGPGLVSLGVPATSVLADPQLRLFDNATGLQLAENEDWGGTPALADLFATLGAFPLAADSTDAALANELAPGVYTAQVTTAATASGVALVETYDATLTGGTHFTNVSVRSVAGTGDKTLIAGFVLNGNAPKKLLIRGIGPSLLPLGLSAAAVLSDPFVALYHESDRLAENDNWAGDPTLKEAFQIVGAFDLTADASKDAALLVTLLPGVYTVQLSGVNNGTGVALIEIYEMP